MDCDAGGGERLRTLQLKISLTPVGRGVGACNEALNFSFFFLSDGGLKKKVQTNLLMATNVSRALKIMFPN